MFLQVFKKIDLVTFGQRDNGFLPVITPTTVLSDPLGLAVHIGGPDLVDFNVEQLLNRFLDLKLIGSGIHLDDDLVVEFLKTHAFFSKTGFLDHITNAIHVSNLTSSCPRQA